MKKPRFSFIIPCYKAENTIAKAIGSMLDQDFKDFEIICVLDGPDEMTESIIKSFPEVKYKVIEHGGAPKARNEGFKMSTGEIVLFSDSDVYWNAGILRKMNEEFEKDPDLGFVYAGFRWSDMSGAHVPCDFDPYLLKICNFIDTGNPVRREWVEKVGGWDESLKRWQDWDLWLRIVEAGAKGKKISDISRSADPPKEGSISGTDNYAPTYHIVRQKHEMPNKDVCVTSIAAPGHGLRVAKSLDYDYWHNPAMLPNDYKAVHLLGCFPEGINDHVQLFLDWRTKKPRTNCVYIIHWIGTDILHMRVMLPFLQIRQIRMMFEKYNVVHLFQSEQNAEEMRELGFKGEVLPLPVEDTTDFLPPTPEKFTVAVYDHGGIDEKWHKALIMEVAKAMPHVEFKFFGNKNAVGKDRNTEWMGHVSINEVISKSSALLRLTVHDGYPVAPVEFMFSGRRVITNVPAMQFTNHLELGVITEERFVELKEMIFREIQKVKELGNFTDAEQKKVNAHYKELLSPTKFKKRIQEIIENAKEKVS